MEHTFNFIFYLFIEIVELYHTKFYTLDLPYSDFTVPTSGVQKKISIGEIVNLLDIGSVDDPVDTFFKNCQKIGYALKKMKIEVKRLSVGRWVVYNKRTISRLMELQRIFDGFKG